MFLLVLFECIRAAVHSPSAITRLDFDDGNRYEDYVLTNGIKVIVVQNKDFSKASICLGVGAGDYNGPAEMQGVADLLTSIIGEAAKNSSDTISFTDKLSNAAHGSGEFTYVTHVRSTHYSITMPYARDLANVAETLARVVADPALSVEKVMGGVRRMEAEYHHSKVNIMSRLYHILADCMKEKFCKYVVRTGNGEALRDSQRALRKVKRFWDGYYIGTNMCLVICSSLSFNAMKDIANMFNIIRKETSAVVTIPGVQPLHPENNKHLSVGHFIMSMCDGDPTIYEKEHRGHLHRTAALGNQNAMAICTSLPNGPFYEAYPVHALKAMITKAIEEYLHPEMQFRAWGSFLECIIAEQHDILQITVFVVLTQSGIDNYSTILGKVRMLFRRFIRSSEPAFPSHMDGVQAAMSVALNFFICLTPEILSSHLARAAFVFPIENLLNYALICKSLDTDMLKGVVEFMSEEANWVVVLFDKKFTSSQADCRAKYSDIYYRKERLDVPDNAVVFLPGLFPEEDNPRLVYNSKVGTDSLLAPLISNMDKWGLTLSDDNQSGKTARSELGQKCLVVARRESACIAAILIDIAYYALRAFELMGNIGAGETFIVKDRCSEFIKVTLGKQASRTALRNATQIFVSSFLTPLQIFREVVKVDLFVSTQISSFFERAQRLGVSCLDGPEDDMFVLMQDIFSTVDLTSDLVPPASAGLALQAPVPLPLYQGEKFFLAFDCRKLSVPEEIKRLLPRKHPSIDNMFVSPPLSEEISYVHFSLRIQDSISSLTFGEQDGSDTQVSKYIVYDMLVADILLALSQPIFLNKMNQLGVYVHGKESILLPYPEYFSIHFMATSQCKVADLERSILDFIMQLPKYIAAIPSDTFNEKIRSYFAESVAFYKAKAAAEDKSYANYKLPIAEYLRYPQYHQKHLLSVMSQSNLVKYCEFLSLNSRRFIIPSVQGASEYESFIMAESSHDKRGSTVQ